MCGKVRAALANVVLLILLSGFRVAGPAVTRAMVELESAGTVPEQPEREADIYRYHGRPLVLEYPGGGWSFYCPSDHTRVSNNLPVI